LRAWNQLLLRENLCRFGNSIQHGARFDGHRLSLSFFAVQILGLFSLRVMHQNIDSTGTLTTDFDSLSRFFKIKILRFLPCIWVYDGLAPKSRLLEIDVVEGGPEAVLLVCVAEGGI